MFDFKTKCAEYHKSYPDNKVLHWNGAIIIEWEFRMLKDIGAITDFGIKREYPMLAIVKNNDRKIIDVGGDRGAIQNKIAEINSKNIKIKARIIYLPHLYPAYREYQNSLWKNK